MTDMRVNDSYTIPSKEKERWRKNRDRESIEILVGSGVVFRLWFTCHGGPQQVLHVNKEWGVGKERGRL